MGKNDSNIIGVQEKRELAKIIDADFERIISNLQQEIKFTEGEILEQAHKKFGIKAINLEITHLREKIDLLAKRKKDLGFDSYDKFQTVYTIHGSEIETDSKAGRYFYLKASKHADIQLLHRERAKRLKELWLTDQRPQVAKIANSDIKVKLLEHKK